MNVLIIEDEVKTAKALARLIAGIQPEAKIIALIQSVATAVQFLQENEAPDLIFMDIQLADGLSFDIFKQVKIVSPVVFCTAYDDYAIEAFKANGIDYVLKPIAEGNIRIAFEKVHALKNFFQTHKEEPNDIGVLLNRIEENNGKKSFLVFKNNKYLIVPTDQIAFFYIKNEMSTITTFAKEEFSISQSLDEVSNLLPSKQFFRLNRQYLINFKAVLEVEPYFMRKLLVRLTIEASEKLLVGKDKVTAFLSWLENR